MINRETIAKMKDGVVIVNTGRGKCVDEADMVAALEVRQGRAPTPPTCGTRDPPDRRLPAARGAQRAS